MQKYAFLSDEWVGEAKRIYAEAGVGGAIAGSTNLAPVRVNLIVTDAPFASAPVDAHVDTSAGRLDIDVGHLWDPDVTISLGYDTARSLFVQGDVQAVLQAFLGGRIKVDGDLSKLLDPRSGIWPASSAATSPRSGAAAGGGAPQAATGGQGGGPGAPGVSATGQGAATEGTATAAAPGGQGTESEGPAGQAGPGRAGQDGEGVASGNQQAGEQQVGEQGAGEQQVGEQGAGEQQVGEQGAGEQQVGEKGAGGQGVGGQRVGEQGAGGQGAVGQGEPSEGRPGQQGFSFGGLRALEVATRLQEITE
jgi:hypothetical protein